MVVPYVGTWIEIQDTKAALQTGQGRSLRGNVDRNIVCMDNTETEERRSLRGNVDRNGHYETVQFETSVVPYVGTWIEILKDQQITIIDAVVPYVGTWIEISSPART